MRKQFSLLFKYKKNIDNLLTIMSKNKLKNNKILTKTEWFDILLKLIKYPDKKIYKILRKMYKQFDTFSDDRGAFMANKIINIVKPLNIELNSLLDYGCANGTITMELAKQLNINKIYGADIVPIKNVDFNFILLDKNNLMPEIKDNSIDFINASMVLHHISNINETLQEFKRIISLDGILVVRDHDCNNNSFSTFLDILHGLYSLVWSNPIEDPKFVEEYKANYKSYKEWDRLLWSFGFKKIYFLYKKSNINAYYAVYKLINIKDSRTV
jgi:ubiquinone/menaquinone biosynthesis C-methylase UbiE